MKEKLSIAQQYTRFIEQHRNIQKELLLFITRNRSLVNIIIVRNNNIMFLIKIYYQPNQQCNSFPQYYKPNQKEHSQSSTRTIISEVLQHVQTDDQSIPIEQQPFQSSQMTFVSARTVCVSQSTSSSLLPYSPSPATPSPPTVYIPSSHPPILTARCAVLISTSTRTCTSCRRTLIPLAVAYAWFNARNPNTQYQTAQSTQRCRLATTPTIKTTKKTLRSTPPNYIIVFNRVCLPESPLMRQQIFESLLKVDLQDEKIVEIGSHLSMIINSIAVSIISTLLLIVIMRYTACVSVYVLLVLMVALLFLLALYMYAESLQASQLTEYFGQSLSQQSLQNVMAVTFVVIGVFIFVLFCCNRKKISLAIKLLKSSAKFVNNHLYLIVISFIECFCGLTSFIWWIVELWGLVKAQEIYIRNNDIEISPQMNNFFQTLIIVVHVFYFLWTYNLITQSGSFIVSGAVANWYFSNQTTNVCCPSYDRYTGYHIGSVCAASFYLTVLWPIRLILQWMRSEFQRDRKTIFGNIEHCNDLLCCMAINRLLTICNKGTYAYIHITGKNYCESSSKVMSLRLAQPVISGIMTFLEIIFNIILRLQVVVITVFWGYWTLHNVEPYKFQQYEPSLTLICITCGAYFVSKTFLTVYLEATDAIIICVLVDKDENKDFVNCPQQFGEDLQQIIDEKGFDEEIQ